MKLSKTSGAMIAATAASMLLAGAVIAPQAAQAAAAKVHCLGANACKGQSSCKSGNHACKGQNACKGQGFIDLTAKTCLAKGGKVQK
jgi:uncharacterized membrane protein